MVLTTPKDLKQAQELNKYTDAYLVGLKDYIPNFLNPFSFTDFLELIKFQKKVVLRLDILIRERDIEKYKYLISKTKDLDIYYYITDQGLLNYLINLNLANKTIYDPFTMLTNYEDAKTYYNLGLLAVAPSLEIPYNDILKFNMPMFYLGFGRRLMFNSKRKLISLYFQKANIKTNLENLTIIEEKRTDILPIFEDYGTYIYRSYFSNNIELIKENKNIQYILLDSNTLEFKQYLEIVKNSYLYLNNKITSNIYQNNISNLTLPISDGFTYQDTIYQKEAIENAKN